MVPSRPFDTIASSDDSTMAASRFCASCARLASVISRLDSRTERMFPEAWRSATHRVETVLLAPFAQLCLSSPAHCPSRSNFSLIDSSGSGNSVRNKSWLTWPIASSRLNPYISVAPLFQNVIRSEASRTRIASLVKSSSRAFSSKASSEFL